MTLEQARAIAAHDNIQALVKSSDEDKKRYATVIYQTIALVQNAGLVQTLEFINALSNATKKAAADRFLGHLAAQLKRVDSRITNADTLRDRVRRANLRDYMHLTRETMATLVWYRRFVQSILKIDISAINEDNES
ncbi:MAG: hypothetical protein KAI47_18515 [Deltaproteobacteria bacterium]|nr:hypothetical protein [Deltaproteobacteria bacterium]